MQVFTRTIFILVFCTMSLSASALDGIPSSFKVNNKNLVLNGEGKRTKFILTLYNAGLYLESKSDNTYEIIAADKPMAIRLKIKSGFASAKKMEEALLLGFNNATNGKTAPIKAEINQLLKAAFTSNVSKGDIFDLAYIPGSGTHVLKNSMTVTIVRGLAIKQALFGIWLSDKPAQATLKREMLGRI